MLLSVGMVKTSGLLFVTFQDRFQSSSSMTSLISTVQNICFSLTCMIVMAVAIKLTTCRNLVFVGSTILTIAFIVTSQADNIYVLLISHGVLQGTAVAFNETALLVMLSHYFEKRRGFAISIASSGSSVGALVFAPLVVKLLTVYGFKGGLLIVAGILFNGCISGALFRPTSFYEINYEKETNALQDEGIQEKLMKDHYEEELCDEFVQNTDDNKKSRKLIKKPNLLEHTSLKFHAIESSKSCKSDTLIADKVMFRQLGELPSAKSLNDCSNTNDKYKHLSHRRRRRTVSESVTVAPSIMDAISNSSVAKYASSYYIQNSIVDMARSITETRERSTANAKITQQDTPKNTATVQSSFRNCFKILDFELFKRPVFVCILIAASLICPGTMLSQVFFPPYARDIGVSVDDVATLITIYNVIDIVSRIFVGVIADRGWLRRSTLAAIATAIVSLIAHLLRFYSSYSLLIVYAVILSLVGGVYFSLFVVILVDYMTLEKLHSCIGFISLCHGFSVAGGFYLIGYLRDVTGSYVVPYHVIGAMAAVGALILLLLPFIEKIEKK